MNKKITDYVFNLFVQKFPQYRLKLQKNEILEILYNNICNASDLKKYSVDDIQKGYADDTIVNLISDYFKKEKSGLWEASENLKNSVRNIINEEEAINYSDELNDYIVNYIVSKLLGCYDYNDLINGEFDTRIKILYEEVKKDIYESFASNIKRVVINEVDAHRYVSEGIDQFHLESSILDMLLKVADYSFITELDSGKFDKDILYLIEFYINGNKKKMPDVFLFIKDIILEQDNTLSEEELADFAMKIENELRKNGFHSREIVSFDMKDDIVKYFYYFKQLKQSVKEKNDKLREMEKKERIKRITKKRRVQQGIISLVVLATLLGSAQLIKYGYNNTMEYIDDRRAIRDYNIASSKIEGDEYRLVFTKYSDSYKNNMELTVNNYGNYSKFGKIYGDLALYDAYMHVSDNRLAIMDTMLHDMNFEYNLNVGTSFYLQFMYNALVNMGCEEVQQEKYVTVIGEYVDAYFANDDKNRTTWDCLDDEQKDLIEEISIMYKKYSSDLYKEFADITVLGLGERK